MNVAQRPPAPASPTIKKGDGEAEAEGRVGWEAAAAAAAQKQFPAGNKHPAQVHASTAPGTLTHERERDTHGAHPPEEGRDSATTAHEPGTRS